MTKHQYRVYGYRYRHVNWPSWAMVERLPVWLEEYRKHSPKLANKWWEVQRMYYRLQETE